MRKLSDNRFDKWRIPHPAGELPPELRSFAGAFVITLVGTHKGRTYSAELRVIASRADDRDPDPIARWDHISVSLVDRCPTWEEMCFVKEKFFYPDEVAYQLHPVSEYINNHPYCLHLWRPLDAEIPIPPSILVGLKELNVGEVG